MHIIFSYTLSMMAFLLNLESLVLITYLMIVYSSSQLIKVNINMITMFL